MIDRIQGTTYYSSSSSYEKKVKSNTETFSMEYKPREFTAETEEEKKTREAGGSAIEKLLDQEGKDSKGVRLELTSVQKEEAAKSDAVQEEGFLDQLSKRLKILWSDIRSAFSKFWNGDVEVISEKDMTVEDTAEEPEEKPKTQEQVRQEMLDALYEHGEKNLAKNSDLLTSYNKNGAIVQMDAGEKNRILHVHPHQIDETF